MHAYIEHDPVAVVPDVVDISSSERLDVVRQCDVVDLDSHYCPVSLRSRPALPPGARSPPTSLVRSRRRRRQPTDVDAEASGNDVIARHAGSVEFELDDVRHAVAFFRRNCA